MHPQSLPQGSDRRNLAVWRDASDDPGAGAHHGRQDHRGAGAASSPGQRTVEIHPGPRGQRCSRPDHAEIFPGIFHPAAACFRAGRASSSTCSGCSPSGRWGR
ncbi:MAG: hypothetical protein MZV64_34615 [Ignavibacteriales bacterium]|nr:hypothetical protein [Ignavibacteriales bacterium]